MGWLKKIGKGLGKALSVAAPVLAMTGVGAPLAIGAGALGGAMQGGKPKQWLKRAAIGGGVAGLGALAHGTGLTAKLGSAAKGAVSKGGWLSKLGGGMSRMGSGMMGGGGPPGIAPPGIAPGRGVPGAGGGMARTLADLAPVALGAYGAYQGNQDMNRARRLDERMLGMAEQDYAQRAPVRARAQQMMMGMGGGGMPSSNPFAR